MDGRRIFVNIGALTIPKTRTKSSACWRTRPDTWRRALARLRDSRQPPDASIIAMLLGAGASPPVPRPVRQ